MFKIQSKPLSLKIPKNVAPEPESPTDMDGTLTLPGNHVMEVVEGKLEAKLKTDFFMFKDGVMIDKNDRWILPTNYVKFANFIHKFSYHSTDVIVSTFPKSGTTWVQEIVWNLLHNPNTDNPDAKLSIDARSPSLHADMLLATTGAVPLNPQGELVKRFRMLFPGKELQDGVLLHLTALNPPPRVMKTHLPLSFLPQNLPDMCKVIYVVRGPRDVINSLYFFMRLNTLYGYTGTRDEFVNYFINDKVCFGPYWKHVQLAWSMRDHPNFLFLYYEDMVEDIVSQVKKIDLFLGTKRTDEQIKNIVDFTKFDSLKDMCQENPPSSYEYKYFNKEALRQQGGFYRKGKVGDWKENFTPDQVCNINDWMSRNMTFFGDDFRYKPPSLEPV